MKICFVNQPWNPAIPPVESASIAIWTYEVAKRMTDKCEVLVYAKSVPGEPDHRIADGVLYRRCSNEPVPTRLMPRLLNLGDTLSGNRIPVFARRRFYSAYFRRVAEMIREDAPDVVNIHNFGQAVPVIRAVNPNIRIVLHMHCEWLTQLPRPLVQEWIRQVDAVVGCSEYITAKIRAAWPELDGRCHRVCNGINTELFKPEGKRQKMCGDGEDVILFVGRLTPEKGLHVLIDAFKEVLQSHGTAKLVMVGHEAYTAKEYLVDLSDDPVVRDLARFYRGDYLGMLKSMIDDSLSNKVTLTGHILNHQLPAYYRGAYVLANPSLSESFGMTLAEAMACGLPVVATEVGGMPEVLGGRDCGLTCTAADPAALAGCLLEILRNRDRRLEMGKQAAQRAADLFSWSKIAEDAFKANCSALNR